MEQKSNVRHCGRSLRHAKMTRLRTNRPDADAAKLSGAHQKAKTANRIQ
jgi:hypothetical protein